MGIITNMFNGVNNKTVINGKTINVPSGASVSIIQDKIYIDGKPYEHNEELKEMKVTFAFEGELSDLRVSGSLNVSGDIKSKRIEAQSVNCDNIVGDVHAVNSVNCDDIEGNVSAGNSVICDDVTGNISAKRVIQ